MQILIFSDTHGSTQKVITVIKNTKDVCAVIHAGDMERDAEYIASQCVGIPVYAVAGNNEFFPRLPYDREETVCGRHIFITHGHTHGVKYGMSGLYDIADSNNYDLIVYGHTHKASTDFRGKTIIINPGSAKYYPSTYAAAEIKDGKLYTRICEF